MTSPTDATVECLAAMLSGRADRPLLRSMAEEDWFALFVMANRDRHRLVPALHRVLCRGELAEAVPEDVRGYLAVTAELNEERNAAIRLELSGVVAALNAAGIEPMLLKGAAVLAGPRLAVADRMVGDIDVLVPEGRGADALAALKRAGFDPILGVAAPGHTVADLERVGNRASVDLHWELLDPPFRRLLPAGGVLLRSERAREDGLSYRLPTPQDHVLHGLLHAQVHNPGYYSRHLCLSMAREVAAFRDEVDWGAVEGWMEAHGLRLPVEATLLAARHFFGMGWPLSRSAAAAAIRHHRRACEVEVTGRWDAGIGRLAKLRELFAPDRLAVGLGAGGSYAGDLARLCGRALERRSAREMLRRFMRD